MMTPSSTLHKISKQMFFCGRGCWNTTCRMILLSFSVVIICGSPLLAQNKYDFAQFRDETGSFIKQPSKWDRNDWIKLGIVSVGSFVLMEAVDQPVRDFLSAGQKVISTAYRLRRGEYMERSIPQLCCLPALLLIL